MTFSQWLTRAVEQSGLTQKQMAGRIYRPGKQAGSVRPITQRTLQNWLSGRSEPSGRLTYVSLGLALGLDYAGISRLVRTYTGRDLFVRSPDDILLCALALGLCPLPDYETFCRRLAGETAAPVEPDELRRWEGEGPTREMQLAFSACRTQEEFLQCFRRSLPGILAGVRRMANELERIYTLHAPHGTALRVHLENRLPFLKSNYEKLREGLFDSGTSLLTIRLCLFLGFSAAEIDDVLRAGHYSPISDTPFGAVLKQTEGRCPHEVWIALEQLGAQRDGLPPELTVKYLPCTRMKTEEKALAALLFGAALLAGRRRAGSEERFFTCLANVDSLLLGCLSGQHIHRRLRQLAGDLAGLDGQPSRPEPERFVRQTVPALVKYAAAHELDGLVRPLFGLPLPQYAGDFRAAAMERAGTLRGPLPGSDAYCLPPAWLPDAVRVIDRGRLAEEHFFAALLYTLFFERIYCRQTDIDVPDGLTPGETRLFGLVVRYCRAHLLPERPVYIRPVYETAVRQEADGRTARLEYLVAELAAALAAG